MKYIESYQSSECYCCGNKSLFTLGTRTEQLSNAKCLYSFTFEDVVCERCAFVFSRQRQQQEEIAHYYKFYHSNASTTSEEEHKARYEYLKSYINNESVVYEIGGGINSSFSKFIKSKGTNIKNIEVTDRLPKGDAVDLIVCYYLLEHINELDNFLIQINDLLKVGGFFVFEVPDFCKNPAASLNEEHVNHFNLSSIMAMADRYGFELVSKGFEQGARSFGSVAILKKKSDPKDLSGVIHSQRFKSPPREFPPPSNG